MAVGRPSLSRDNGANNSSNTCNMITGTQQELPAVNSEENTDCVMYRGLCTLFNHCILSGVYHLDNELLILYSVLKSSRNKEL